MADCDFIHALIEASEKAANIARVIRSQSILFDLLVQEKTGLQKNTRFLQDFKTLADVLIQETIKNQLGNQFPGISSHIYGEESNRFTNTLGETICVKTMECKDETRQLLSKVLGDNDDAAELLAKEVHRDVRLQRDSQLTKINKQAILPPLNDLGIWIDPIDSTAEYIDGDEHAEWKHGIACSGLPCVTVLLGVFHRVSGEAVIGVINQPFHVQDNKTKQWMGRYLWGLCYNEMKLSSIVPHERVKCNEKPFYIVMSNSEEAWIKKSLSDMHIVYTSGAGYKLLCIAEGLAHVYILSKPGTYYWDTCAPHAILKALGGNIYGYTPSVQHEVQQELAYSDKQQQQTTAADADSIQHFCNRDGLLAFINASVFQSCLQRLQQSK